MKPFAMEKVLSGQQGRLLDLLYSAPCSPDNWSAFLQMLVAVTGSRSARMLVMDRRAEMVLDSIKHNIDDSAHQQYVAHYVNTCPWRPELKDKPTGRLYSSYLDFSCRQNAYYQTEFYNDWARHLDIHHGVCGTVWQDDDFTVQLLIQRTRGQEHYSQEETRMINGVVGHVRRAIRLQTQFDAMRVLAAASEVHAPPYAVLDCNGCIVHLSDAARHLLDEHPAVACRDQRLQCRDLRQQQRLQRMLASVIPVGGSPASAGSCLTLLAEGHPPLQLLVSPLPIGPAMVHLLNAQVRPLALIYFNGAFSQWEVNKVTLTQLWGLTDAEANVAVKVAQGLAPQDIAEAAECSVHTIRTQLKSVFRKTGTSRQNELATLVLGSSAARRPHRPVLRLQGLEPDDGVPGLVSR